MLEEDKSFLFVCGCPRSGTTALWQMLMGSADIFLGVERFGGYMTRHNIGTLEAANYEKKRFFDMQDGDTHYNDLASFHMFKPWFPTAEKDYDAASLIGDKIPRLYWDFDRFAERFPGAKVIFIVRNVFDVCLSYQRRKENQQDPWSLDYRKAVEEWNQSIHCFLESAGKEFSGLVVNYEDLFPVDESPAAAAAVERIISFTGVTDGHRLVQSHDALIRKAPGVEGNRLGDKLGAQAKRHILLEADVDSYRQLSRI